MPPTLYLIVKLLHAIWTEENEKFYSEYLIRTEDAGEHINTLPGIFGS